MHPEGTSGHRVALVARTRFVEDLVVDGEMTHYVLLGARLDTFVQRHLRYRSMWSTPRRSRDLSNAARAFASPGSWIHSLS
jgi:hypothetical protein